MSLMPRLAMLATALIGLGTVTPDWHHLSFGRLKTGPGVASAILDSPHTQYREELMLERSFTASRGGTLVIDVPDGNVEIHPGEDNEASVEVFVGARNPEWGRTVFERMRFDARADGDRLRVTARNPQIDREEWRENRGVGVRVAVRVPAAFNAEIRTSDGDIEVGDIHGWMDLASSDGDIVLGNVSGPKIAVRTADGDVSAEVLNAEQITLNTDDGDVVIRDARGTLRATTGDGDIRVYLSEPGDVRLRTGDGDITIYADRSLAARVDLVAEDVDIGSAFRIDGRMTRRGIRGNLNGGGPLLEARTGDGRVALRRR